MIFEPCTWGIKPDRRLHDSRVEIEMSFDMVIYIYAYQLRLGSISPLRETSELSECIESEDVQLDSTSPPCRQGQASFQTPRSSRGSNYSHASERGASSNESAFHESKRSKNSKDPALSSSIYANVLGKNSFLLRTCLSVRTFLQQAYFVPPFEKHINFIRLLNSSYFSNVFPSFLGFRCGTGWRCRGNQLFSTNGRLKESLFQIPGRSLAERDVGTFSGTFSGSSFGAQSGLYPVINP